MQDLKVIGVESGALLVATDGGAEFRLPVTLSLQSQVRAADAEHSKTERKVPPRDIQASIRSGRTAEQVAAATGVELDYVRRFEGPVLAERSFVLDSARKIAVSIATDGDITSQTSRFGDVIDSRLDSADAVDRDWTSFKDPEKGWVVHVTYTTNEVEREASWRFDPKKQSLAPLDGDAHTLSRQNAETASLVPRLRAVAPHVPESGDTGRFDSGAFETLDQPADGSPAERVRSESTRADGRSAASVAAMNRAPDDVPAHNQTADLLEALRRRRGEREAARFDDAPSTDSRAMHPSTGSIRVIDVPLDDFDAPEGGDVDHAADTARLSSSDERRGDSGLNDAKQRDAKTRDTKPLATHPTARRLKNDEAADQPESSRASTRSEPQRPQRARKGRASMPSWDEIVFGARSDDDPA